MKNTIIYSWFFLSLNFINAQELIIGEERIEPGLVFIFEGAIKDHVSPTNLHLRENETNIHIEARVNWDNKNIPAGTPAGGFIPYLHLTAKITNENTGMTTYIDLLPHINLIDNFHYARNISLPGESNDPYTVKFNIMPPANVELAMHKDWNDKFGNVLFQSKSFTYNSVNFEEIAKASRR